MHWGVRRFQNPDGTLTAAGKKRYSSNPITRFKQKREERRIAKEQEKERNRIFKEKLDDLESRAQKIEKNDYWLHIYEDWQGPSAEEFRKAWNKAGTKIYEDDELYDQVGKKAYKYGYDAGTYTATKLEKEFGRDALNRWIDMYAHENSYNHQLTDKDFEQFEKEDPVKRFAHIMGVEEWANM